MDIKKWIIVGLIVALGFAGWRLYAAGQDAERTRAEIAAYREVAKNQRSGQEAADKANNESKAIAAETEKEVVYVRGIPVKSDCDSAPVDAAIDLLRDKDR